MKPPTATMPISPEPGSTRRPSSVNTALFSVIMNRAVCSAWPAADTEMPSPTASDEPNESTSSAWGMWRSRPCLLSWLHITPDEPIDDDARQVVAAGVGVEVVEHRAGERLADDDEVGGTPALDGLEQLGDVELAVGERDRRCRRRSSR